MGGERGLTGSPGLVPTLVARASQPIINAISFTRAFVSRDEVDEERSWESFAWRQGCLETWTFGGRLDMLAVMLWVVGRGEKGVEDEVEEVKKKRVRRRIYSILGVVSICLYLRVSCLFA